MPTPQRREAAIATLLGLVGLAALVAAWAALRESVGHDYDLAAYLGAAARVAAGGTPYQPETLGGPFRPGPAELYLYPPGLAVLLAPFAGLPGSLVSAGWFALRVGALAAGCALMPVRPWIRGTSLLVAAASYPVLLDVNLGNVSVVVFALTAAAWRFLDRPSGSIAVAAALALRPPLLLVVAWWALRRRWGPIAWAFGAAVVLAALALPFVGLAGYTDYLVVVRNLTGMQGVPRNADFGSLALAAGLPPPLPTLAFIGGALAGLGIMLAGLRRDRDVAFVTAVGASLLLAPLLWVHYLVALILPAALLADRGRRWAILLPLLGWLPEPFLPFVAMIGALAPLLAAPPGVDERQPVADLRS